MRTTTISNQSDSTIVTTTANTANVATPIFSAKTPTGTAYILKNKTMVKGQLLGGTYIILDLNTSAGTRISASSKIIFSVRGPADEFAKPKRAIPYAVWHDVTALYQRNEDYMASIIGQTDLGTGEGVMLKEGWSLVISVEGPDVVDWTKSSVQYKVEERN
ncbi:MAG TPA: hypothetical protein VHN99_12375 [Deinococcales bacterium]|nr:hypothetical protein [Deinococcales bacterium]